MSCTEENKEQILAIIVLAMVIRRLVCIPVDPRDPLSISEQRIGVPNSQSRCVIHNGAAQDIADIPAH